MLPVLGANDLGIIAALVVVAVIGKATGNETRLWLMCLVAVTLAPSAEVLVVAGIVGASLRLFDMLRAWW